MLLAWIRLQRLESPLKDHRSRLANPIVSPARRTSATTHPRPLLPFLTARWRHTRSTRLHHPGRLVNGRLVVRRHRGPRSLVEHRSNPLDERSRNGEPKSPRSLTPHRPRRESSRSIEVRSRPSARRQKIGLRGRDRADRSCSYRRVRPFPWTNAARQGQACPIRASSLSVTKPHGLPPSLADEDIVQ